MAVIGLEESIHVQSVTFSYMFLYVYIRACADIRILNHSALAYVSYHHTQCMPLLANTTDTYILREDKLSHAVHDTK